jgi:hypothetical protein
MAWIQRGTTTFWAGVVGSLTTRGVSPRGRGYLA